MSRSNKSVLWEYFQKLDNVNKQAKCKACFEVYSYKSTTGNLKTHLKKKHPNHFKRVASKQIAERMTASINAMKAEEHEESSDQPSTENSNRGFSQKRRTGTAKSIDVWSYYKVCGSRMECLACDAVVPRCEEDAQAHLREKHEKLMAEDLYETKWDESGDVRSSRSPNADSDSDNDDQDAAEEDVFTEVFYVNENPLNVVGELKKEKVATPRKSEVKRPKRRKISEQICYDMSEEEPVEVRYKSRTAAKSTEKKQNGDDLDTFSVYMLSLMRSLPNDVCTKLQMDIINLIMAEKLKFTQQPRQEINRAIPAPVPVSLPVSVVDQGPLTLRAVPGTSGVASYVVVTSTDTGGDNVQDVNIAR